MSLRTSAPYADRIEEDGRVLIYEGHDINNRKGSPEPKSVVQVPNNPGGSLTQNGKFFKAAKKYKKHTENCLRQVEQEKWLGAIQDVLMD